MSKPLPRSVKALLQTHNPPNWAINVAKGHASKRARWSVEGTPFFVGQKQIFLPRFTITLVRTPSLGAEWAQFIVPLWFNKLDIRDYLFHVYSVRVHAVRSALHQQRVQTRKLRTPHYYPGKRLKWQPKPIKKMTVLLDRPFVWPEEPQGEELENWERARAQSLSDEISSSELMLEEQGGRRGGTMLLETSEQLRQRQRMRDNAERLLQGRGRWSQASPEDLPSAYSDLRR